MSLLNAKAVKQYILATRESVRPGWKADRVCMTEWVPYLEDIKPPWD